MSSKLDLSFLDKETDAGFLREFSKVIARENAQLRAEIEAARAAKEISEQTELDLKEKYARLRRDFFGRGREKLDDTDVQRARESEAVLFHAQSLVPAPTGETHQNGALNSRD